MKIRCPQCDAAFEVGTEHIIVKCPYCDVRLFYKKDKYISRESIKPNYNSRVAKRLLEKITGKVLKVKEEYFPFYRISDKGKTYFIPGKSISLYGLSSYIPQGDRIPLDFDAEEPHFDIDTALMKADVTEADSVSIVYLPFFTARDKDRIYYFDSARGEILSNGFIKKRRIYKNLHPLSLLNWIFFTIIILFLPENFYLRIITAIVLAAVFYYFDKGKYHV